MGVYRLRDEWKGPDGLAVQDFVFRDPSRPLLPTTIMRCDACGELHDAGAGPNLCGCTACVLCGELDFCHPCCTAGVFDDWNGDPYR